MAYVRENSGSLADSSVLTTCTSQLSFKKKGMDLSGFVYLTERTKPGTVQASIIPQ